MSKLNVFNDVTFWHIFRAVGVSRGFNFFIGDGGQSHSSKHCLQCAGRFVTNGDDVFFTHRTQTPVDFQVTLENVVVVKVFGIFVRACKHVVVVRHGGITGRDEVSSWQELHQQTRGTAHIRVGKGLVVTGGAFEIQ
ncbi:hypothetical protein D3C81_1721680 [compost metagenome]